jgi:hypothetical protein
VDGEVDSPRVAEGERRHMSEVDVVRNVLTVVERCVVCDGPVEDADRSWVGESGSRVWFCDLHHRPLREGKGWIEEVGGQRWLRLKEPVLVSRLRI